MKAADCEWCAELRHELEEKEAACRILEQQVENQAGVIASFAAAAAELQRRAPGEDTMVAHAQEVRV